jgi:two-component system KDP operon response regulator KdpE
VIVLSARGQEGDKVIALDMGADDYLTKPFGAGELTARIRAIVRRGAAPGGGTPDVLEVGAIRIDQPRHEVTVEGKLVHLTPIEFKLLVELARQPGRVLTHRQLLRDVWGPSAVEQSHTLRVHVAALRRKLERDPAQPRWLVTEAGVGYRLRDDRG